MWIFWLILSGAFFLIELFTVGFLAFWFAIGALLALVVSFFTSNLVIQILVFVAVSTVLLIFTRPLLKNFINIKDPVPTNVYNLLGKTGIVLEDIDSLNSKGSVKVCGEVWSATSDVKIPKDSQVKILEINGVKLKVEKIKESETV